MMDNENQNGKAIPERSSIDAVYQWHVHDVYKDEAAWQADVERVKLLLDKGAALAGSLHNGPQALEEFLHTQDETGLLLNRVFLYAAMKRDEDNRIGHYQGMRDTAEGLAITAAAKLSFFEPELLSLPEETLTLYLQNPQISRYQKYIDDILRHKPHTLSPEMERLLAESSEMAAAFDNIYSMLADADLQFPYICNEEGEKEQLSHGNYILFLQSKERKVREEAFTGMYETFGDFANTIAATFAASVKKDAFYAKARHYDSSLEAGLFGDNVPAAVYHQLIKTVRNHLHLHHRYLHLRKRMLALPQLHMYDIYTPLLPKRERKYTYEEAKTIVLSALAPLGREYTDILAAGLNNGWVDVYENKGKTSGAYSSGVYSTAPYILMNYQHNLNGLTTLAHEAGHSMHSYYTWRNQPYIYGSYSIFVAEVASTVNENLLAEHLLAQAQSKEEVFYLLNHMVEVFRATVFRQTMFAEFELITHSMAEKGEPLTLEALNKIYRDLNAKYYGLDVTLDEVSDLGWARIPHFYRAFYVYQYATGYSAAIAFKKRLQSGNPQVLEEYLGFLKSGSSDYSIEILKKAGVDMSTPTPVREALQVFEELVGELEKALQ
ncbi:MAG: oligoendopeptidase F [Clostridiales bacterium]|nr:oligoendopeptidase F [Clostridiales bacterium]